MHMVDTLHGSLCLSSSSYLSTHCPRPQAPPQDSQAGKGSCRLPLTLSFFFVASQPSKKLCQKGKWKSVGREALHSLEPYPLSGMLVGP